MKTCGYKNKMNSYLDGELSGAQRCSFEEHLLGCPRCREEVEQYQTMLAELHGLEDREVPPMLAERLHAALSSEILKGTGRAKSRMAWPWVLSTASAVVVIGIVGVAALLGGHPTAGVHRYSNQAASTSGLMAPGAQAESDAIPKALPAASMAPTPAPTAAPAAALASIPAKTDSSVSAKAAASEGVMIANPWKDATSGDAAKVLGGTFYTFTTLSQDYEQYALMVTTSDVVKNGSVPTVWVRFKKGDEDVSLQMSIGGKLSDDELKGTKVAVNGADAYFMSKDDGTTQIAWESNGITFLISTSTPWSQADLVSLAEGVQAVQ